MEEIYSAKKVEQINDHLFIDVQITKKLAWMIWRWMIAKCVRDKKTKLGQYRRYQSWDSLGEYRLRRKGRVNEMGFQLLKEKRGWKNRTVPYVNYIMVKCLPRVKMLHIYYMYWATAHWRHQYKISSREMQLWVCFTNFQIC